MKFIKIENIYMGENKTKTDELYIAQSHIKSVNNYNGNSVVTYGSGDYDYFVSDRTVEEMVEFIEQYH